MAIRLIALDLDGTLLDSKKQISAETVKTLEAAAAKGIRIVPCTGRLYNMVPEEIKRLPFIHYIITVNGSRIYDQKEGRVIYQAEIPQETAERVLDYVQTLPAAISCSQDDFLMIDKECYDRAEQMFPDPWMLQVIRRRNPIENMRQAIRQRNLPLETIQVFLADSEQGEQEFDRIAEMFKMCSVESATSRIIEIQIKNATKGNALAYLCKMLDIDLNECMAIGDEMNDISMLRIAGVGVAMGNARDAVKSAAKWVTDSNNNDGAAKTIWRYVFDTAELTLHLEESNHMGIGDILKRHKWIVVILAALLSVDLFLLISGGDKKVILSGMLLNHDPEVSEDMLFEAGSAFLADLQTGLDHADVALLTDWTYVTDGEEKAEDNYYTIQALSTYVQEGLLDFVTGDQPNMVLLAYGDFFVDLSTALSAEQMEQYAPYLRYMDMALVEEAQKLDNEDMMAIINGETAEFPDCTKPETMEKPIPVFIDVSGCPQITAFYQDENEPLVFAVMQNAPDPDVIAQWIDFIMG